MERPEALGNTRKILQISFLSGLDNWDLILLEQQMEVGETELLNGTSLGVTGLVLRHAHSPAFLSPAARTEASFQRKGKPRSPLDA